MQNNKFTFLYTEIGRGHPFYLDGIIDLIKPKIIDYKMEIDNVFDCSSGNSKFLFSIAAWLYKNAGSGNQLSKFYKWLRKENNYNNPTLAMRVMGRDITRCYYNSEHPLIVAHPLLVGILAGRNNLIYQHGEMVTPKESLVMNATKLIVPTEEVANKFIKAGYSKNEVNITGLCIEPSIVEKADRGYQLRCDRLKENKHLTGLFLSSGAEPKAHIRGICKSVHSVIKNGSRAYILAQKGGRLEKTIIKEFTQIEYFKGLKDNSSFNANLHLSVYENRQEENNIASMLINEVDYLVAPSHERTNWGMGLGLPFFALLPNIGPYAPLNFQLLKERVQASSVDSFNESDDFYNKVISYKNEGRLLTMAQLGWGKYRINGFQEIAQLLTDWYS